jgi:type IV pilus assembly protein PilM
LLIGTWKRRCGPIGVDLGSEAVKLLQLQPTTAGLRAVAAAHQPLPSDMPATGEAYHQTLGELVTAARRAGHFTGRQVVISLPSAVVACKNMRFPTMPGPELDQAVQWEAPQRLGDAETPMTLQYLDAGAVFQGEERRRELVVMGVQTTFLEQLLELVRSIGLKPLALEAAPTALARCLSRSDSPGSEAGAQVVLDVGRRTSKVLIARRGAVRFFKPIDIGGEHFDQAVAKHLNMEVAEAAELRRGMPYPLASNDADQNASRVHHRVYEALRPVVDELAREVGLCLRYYSVTFRGRRPERVALVGGEARQPWLAPLLADTAGLEVTTIDPIDDVQRSDALPLLQEGPHTEWAVAAGLSLRGQSKGQASRRAA